MAIDLRLAEKGQSEPRDGLAEQGRYSIGLARSKAKDLSDSGWPPTATGALEQGVEALSTKEAAQHDVFETKKGSGATVRAALTGAKALARKLRRVWPQLVRNNPGAGVTTSALEAGEPLGRSASKISGYLGRIFATVARVDVPLSRYFAGRKPSELVAAAKAALDSADGAQELSVSSAPLATQQVYEQKGRVLELIEDLNACGRNAFDGDAPTAALFNKDILNRARAARQAKSAPQPQAANSGKQQPAK